MAKMTSTIFNAGLTRWANAVEMALAIEPSCYDDIIKTARRVAELYQKQWELVL